MNVLKFGGSSVANAERIKNIVSIVKPRLDAGEKLTIVFSAFGGITDLLIEMSELASHGKDKYIALFHQFKDKHAEVAKSLLSPAAYNQVSVTLDENHDTLKDLLKGIFLVREVSPRTLDYVISFGERNANYIIAEAMNENGINSAYLDARKIIKTNKDFGAAKVNFKLTDETIQQYYQEHHDKVQIVTGFIGSDVGGLTTTLGRGGSDYTAAILAGALHAEVLEIWTDVDGVLTCDPRKVKKAFTIPRLSYVEAMEMSHFGAKVIYPPTIQPALRKGIPIYIRNTFNPAFEGTLIHKEHDPSFKSTIKGISSLGNLSLIRLQGSGMMGVPGVSARLFSALGKEKINVILITQASSEHSISIAITDKETKKAIHAITEEFEKEIEDGLIDQVKAESDLCVVAIIGEQMKNVPGVAGRLFEGLGKNGINIVAIAQGSSELNISFVINKQDESKALNAIHDSFFLSDTKRIHVFMVGVGLIGGTLLKQIEEQKETLKTQNGLEITIAGLANTKKMVFAENGIDLTNWKEALETSVDVSDSQTFVDKMIEMNLSNSIFIDNTADGKIPDLYEQVFNASISVATPNKVAASSAYDQYNRLKQLAKRNNVQFLFETNVGAGLPVISTLRNLIQSGDNIIKIEAVLSGSVSFIFNSFDGSKPFSQLVTEAKELGYTEPDPRDDLSGADVARKITILAREAGYKVETSDVVINPILPERCLNAKDVASFFEILKEEDPYFNQLLQKAKVDNGLLRFIAKAENGKISCGVEVVGTDSPFYNLGGSDNMIVFTSQRYKQRPLVVRGPGAGAEVTAAGIFAEIISAGN
ncbi:MAG TPA: bifunctional aspartate kinase/homoserine dehydrogenase I [Saprospiraceae bacterium]|nr:bifunctional aspartate kinase/homoserine dehydrogenase I [Saprospiraceae bacterium]